MRLRDALNRAAMRLRESGIAEPWMEARLLLEAASGLSAVDQISDPDRSLDEATATAFEALVERRASREPLVYILGEKEFHGLAFTVSSDVLTPRPETEILVELVRECLPDPTAPLRILDIGTGSGCLLVTLLTLCRGAFGVGTDLSFPALRIARHNAERHEVGERAGWVCCRWADALRGPFQVIVSNPPYVTTSELAVLQPEIREHEPRLALDGGPEGLDAYRALAHEIPPLLAEDGIAVVELGRGQGGAVAGLMREAGLEIVEIRPDLAGIARAMLLRKPAQPTVA